MPAGAKKSLTTAQVVQEMQAVSAQVDAVAIGDPARLALLRRQAELTDLRHRLADLRFRGEA